MTLYQLTHDLCAEGDFEGSEGAPEGDGEDCLSRDGDGDFGGAGG